MILILPVRKRKLGETTQVAQSQRASQMVEPMSCKMGQFQLSHVREHFYECTMCKAMLGPVKDMKLQPFFAPKSS